MRRLISWLFMKFVMPTIKDQINDLDVEIDDLEYRISQVTLKAEDAKALVDEMEARW